MSEHASVSEAIERFVSADAEHVEDAWLHLLSVCEFPRDARLLADQARAAHQALVEEVPQRQALVEALEQGPNRLLPVLMGLGDGFFVLSRGRGEFERVSVLPPSDDEPPILTPEQLAARGPALAALDPSGALIIEVYWPDQHIELFRLTLGAEEGRVVSVPVEDAGQVTSDQHSLSQRSGEPCRA
ncbi:MAG: hypothetical protein ACP5KN_20475 [Armatimonadota bacterium]